ncbi:hypothetical protein ACI6QG_00210 [Roseococcus sp. DSY-14]|uniref:hypothetical protein n=1 Tax=Roseococcus sp. DSY-14 TaxID=3369650 RepID=UPI00387B4273
MTILTRRVALLACLLLAALCPPAWGQDNPLVQRGIPAEATADNAVQARERAFAAARRAAWQRLAAATGSTQNPSDSQLESMVSAIIVESERTTPTRYVGRLTVQFASGTAGLTRAPGIAALPGQVPPPSRAADPATGSAPAAAVASIAATTSFAGGLAEWLELRRRLLANPAVAGMQLEAISMDAARLRLSLRSQPGEAQSALMDSGIWVDGAGPAWRVGLAGGR